METVKITNIKRESKISKTGKPYTSLRMQTEKHQENWLSGFGNKDNQGWNVGDTVEIEVKMNGQYYNFETPKAPLVSYQSSTAQTVGNAEVKNAITLKVIPLLQQNNELLKELCFALKRDVSHITREKPNYPFLNSDNNAHGLDTPNEITESDLPF